MRRMFCLGLSMLSFLLLTSCAEDKENNFTTETIDATLVWSGDYAVDGCGFVLHVGEEKHKPVNEAHISDSYKTASPTEVEAKIINYHRKDRVPCGFAGAEMNSIKIISLRAR